MFQTEVVEKIETHIFFQYLFPNTNATIVEKISRAGHATNDM